MEIRMTNIENTNTLASFYGGVLKWKHTDIKIFNFFHIINM